MAQSAREVCLRAERAKKGRKSRKGIENWQNKILSKMLPLGKVCEQPLLSLTRICENWESCSPRLGELSQSDWGVCRRLTVDGRRQKTQRARGILCQTRKRARSLLTQMRSTLIAVRCKIRPLLCVFEKSWGYLTISPTPQLKILIMKESLKQQQTLQRNTRRCFMTQK
jgi:hypothetical protein